MDKIIPHILIVDDDANLLETLSDILKLKGFAPVTAQTGAAALSQLEKHSFDLALIDLRLDDMSGLLILRAIKTHSPKTECILLTGHASQDTAISAIQMGVYGYFQKPFDMEQVLLSIQRAVEKKQSAQALHRSEQRYRGLFEDTPLAIWEEDFSEVKKHLDSLKQQGITDFQAYFTSHPEIVFEYAALIKLVDVNNAAVKMYQAENRKELLESTHLVLSKGEQEHLHEDFIKIAEGKTSNSWEGGDETVTGEPIEISLSWSVSPGHEDDFAKVIVTTIDVTQRKRAEETLRNSEKRFRALIENGRDNISLLTADGSLLWESPSTISTLGYAPNQFVGRNLFELMHPDDLSPIQDQYVRLIQTPGGKQDGTFRLRHNDGKWLWIESTATNMLNEPSVRAIVINYRDITERKQAEEKLAQTEERFRSLIENAPDGVVLVGVEGTYKYASPAALRMFGYSLDDAQGHSPANHTHPEDLPMVLQVLQHLITNPSKVPTIQYRFKHLDGSWRWIESTFTNMLTEPSVEAIVINFRDITESKLARDAQQESELQFRALFELSPDAVMLIDPYDKNISWPIIDCNTAACQMNGYSRDELIGHSIDVVNLEPATLSNRNAYIKRIREEGNVHLETYHRHKNGTIFPIEVSTSIITVGGRELMIGIDRDITERKRTELEIKERTEDLNLINILNEAVNRGDSLDKVLELFTNELRKISVCKDSSVYLLSPDGKNLVIQHLGISPGVLKKIEQLTGTPLPRIQIPIKEAGSFHDASQAEKGIIITDPKIIQDRILEFTDTSHLPAAVLGMIRKFMPQIYKLLAINSVMVLPLVSDNKIIGLLDVTSAEVLTKKDLNRIQKISAQLTAVILRKQAEEALVESEDRYRSIFDGVQDAIFIESKDGRILEMNNRACEMYGYQRDEFIGKTVSDIVAKESGIFLLHDIESNISSLPLESVNRRANGELFPVEVSGKLQIINGEEILLVIVRDITERKKAEDALHESEQKYRVLFDEMLSGVAVHEIICDAQGKPVDYRFLAINAAFEKMTGLTSAAVIGKTVLEVLPVTESYWIERYGQVALTREPAQFENYASELGKYFEVRTFSPEKGKFATIFNDITDRKQAEEALRESEALYRQAIEVAGAVPYRQTYNKNGAALHYDFIGEGIRQITGYSADEFTGALWDSLVQESFLLGDLANYSMEEAIRRVRTGKTSLWKCEHRLLTRDGKIRWVFEAAVELYAENGIANGSIGMFQDITERKQVEEELRESEEKYRLLIDQSPYAISIHQDDKLIFVNRAAIAMMGAQSEDELIGRQMALVHPEALNITQNHLQRILQGETGFAFEDRFANSDGSLTYVEVNAAPFIFKGRPAIQIIALDITNRKRAEENTGQRVKELELLYESGLVFSQLLNPKEIAQKIIALLGEKLNWHHTTIRLIRSQNELELVAFDQPGVNDKAESRAVETRFNNLITRVGEGLSGWAIQQSKIVRLGEVNDDPHYIATYPGLHSGLYVPLKSANRMVGVISIESEKPNAFSEADEQLLATLANQAANAFENARLFQTARQEIIERKRVENLLADERNQLAQRVDERTADLSRVNADLAHAVRVKDEFLASMSHELRTPLTGILGLSEVLQLKIYGELNDKQGKALKNIEESGRHLLDLINDILDLSKIEAGKLELQFAAYSLTDICQSSLLLIKGMAQHKHQQVQYSPPAEPIIVRADARRLKQLLVNLLSNAIKFTPENGELGLDVEANQSERKIKLTVWDKGIGIKPEDMDKLFKPFTQLDSGLAREYSGTGLGLSLVKHLTEMHNGGIEVESIIGQGSRFTIILPWSPQNTTPIPYIMQRGNTGGLNSLSLPAHSKSPLVMYVDDNEMVLQMVSDFLESKQYRVMKVRSGLELLERAAELHPNIMLVDIQMPGIGGMETIRRIRAHPDPLVAAAPVIAVTALAMPADRERCLRAGANDYMSKPLKLKELAATIQRLLESK